MNRPVIVIGAGGHGRVVADALRSAGREVLGFTDADPTRHGARLDGLSVLGDDAVLSTFEPGKVTLANGVGSIGLPSQRRTVHAALTAMGWTFTTVIHPHAVISAYARLAEGVQAMAGVVVQSGAAIGAGAILNTGAVVDHDCVIGAHSHLAPGATLSGGVCLGEECHIGTGAVVIQGIRLGPRVTVGAGAVVVSDQPGDVTLIGVPAHVRNR